MKWNKSYLYLWIIFFITSCDRNNIEEQYTEEEDYVESRIKLYVFKAENRSLRKSIKQIDTYKNISFEGDDANYHITLVARAKKQKDAEKLLDDVTNFSLNWGKQPENQTHFHPDDGFDQHGNIKFKRVIEDSVKLIN